MCSRVTKRPVFMFVSPGIRPGDALSCFSFQDDHSFGVLQSHVHWLWFMAKCSKLKSDFRYTPQSVFDTFPWPQGPSVAQIEAVAAAGCEVRRIRADALPKIKGGLRALYRTLELPGKNPLKDAHAALDAAVLDAYGLTPKKTYWPSSWPSTSTLPRASTEANPLSHRASRQASPTVHDSSQPTASSRQVWRHQHDSVRGQGAVRPRSLWSL